MNASIAEQDSRRPSVFVRWFGAALSFIVPGAGQALHRLPRGLTVSVASAALALIAAFFFATVPGGLGIVLPLVAIVAWRSWCAYDAYRQAGLRRGPMHGSHVVGNLLAFALIGFGIDATAYASARSVIGGAWRLPSPSMAPSILADDYIITRPLRREPQRGDIVVFQYPEDTTREFVKRVIAGPGDTIAMIDRQVMLNGRAMSEPYAHNEEPDVDPAGDDFAWQAKHLAKPIPDYRPSRNTWGPLIVPAASYFVLGDNRDNSLDSRYLGFVARARITAMPTRIYFSRDSARRQVRWSRIGTTLQHQ